jgi:hypothetical protein
MNYCRINGLKVLLLGLVLCVLSSAFVLPLSRRHLGASIPFTHLYASSPPVQAQEGSYWTRSETAPTTTPDIVYILVYNAGTTEEAIHTSSMENDQVGNVEILWAFEEVEDCMEFASLLVQHEPPPSFNMALGAEPVPTPVPLSQILTTTQDMGIMLRLVPLA